MTSSHDVVYDKITFSNACTKWVTSSLENWPNNLCLNTCSRITTGPEKAGVASVKSAAPWFYLCSWDTAISPSPALIPADSKKPSGSPFTASLPRWQRKGPSCHRPVCSRTATCTPGNGRREREFSSSYSSISQHESAWQLHHPGVLVQVAEDLANLSLEHCEPY